LATAQATQAHNASLSSGLLVKSGRVPFSDSTAKCTQRYNAINKRTFDAGKSKALLNLYLSVILLMKFAAFKKVTG